MNPEEARARLFAFLEAQAEWFRRPPSVVYTHTRVGSTNRRQVFARILATDPDGQITALDYWIARAGGIENGTANGQYTPEAGFRVEGNNQPVAADIYDLLVAALVSEPRDLEYVRTINVREVY